MNPLIGKQIGKIRFHFGTQVVQQQAFGSSTMQKGTGKHACSTTNLQHVTPSPRWDILAYRISHVISNLPLYIRPYGITAHSLSKTAANQRLVHSSPFPSSRRSNNTVS